MSKSTPNEIVLLAYYIAAINIETAFHARTKRKDYLPFEGICLTDTFGMHESDDLLSFYMQDNSGPPHAAEEHRYPCDHREPALFGGAEKRERERSERGLSETGPKDPI